MNASIRVICHRHADVVLVADHELRGLWIGTTDRKGAKALLGKAEAETLILRLRAWIDTGNLSIEPPPPPSPDAGPA